MSTYSYLSTDDCACGGKPRMMSGLRLPPLATHWIECTRCGASTVTFGEREVARRFWNSRQGLVAQKVAA